MKRDDVNAALGAYSYSTLTLLTPPCTVRALAVTGGSEERTVVEVGASDGVRNWLHGGRGATPAALFSWVDAWDGEEKAP